MLVLMCNEHQAEIVMFVSCVQFACGICFEVYSVCLRLELTIPTNNFAKADTVCVCFDAQKIRLHAARPPAKRATTEQGKMKQKLYCHRIYPKTIMVCSDAATASVAAC